jgi:dihydrofolate reductase
MPTGHCFMALSLDGFVARPDHGLDWLTRQPTGAEDHGYDAFIAGMDGIVMGSGSFRTVLGFPDWPYVKPVVVLSHTLTPSDIPGHLATKVRISSLTPQALMADLGAQGWSRAYVDGGRVIHSFLRAGLVQDMTLTLIPILIGDGLRMFGPLTRDIDLTLDRATPFPSGLVQLRYNVR